MHVQLSIFDIDEKFHTWYISQTTITNLFQNHVQNFRNNIKIYNRYVTKIDCANINERRTYLTVVVDFMIYYTYRVLCKKSR